MKKSRFVLKNEGFIFLQLSRGRGVLTPDPCERHWGPSLSARVTQKRRSSGEPLATLCRFDHPGNRTPDLPHRKPVRLTTEPTAGTGPKIEPKTFRADVCNHYAN